MYKTYSLRIYDTELMNFTLEKRGLEGLVAEILKVNEDRTHLLPLDLELSGEGVVKWLERRVIPKNRTFVDEILKTLGLSHGYLYRYWHIYTGENSREILKQASAKTMRIVYLMYHTMSPEMAIDRLKESYLETHKKT